METTIPVPTDDPHNPPEYHTLQKNQKENTETKVPMPMTTDDPEIIFGQDPIKIKCTNCQQAVITRVEDSIKSEGWMFACCCCIFGSWLVSFLVCNENDYKMPVLGI